jgi:DNA-directed RNA polymerase subunit RPC12/RpoP
MSQKTLPTICTECGKKFERYGADWGYVRETKTVVRAYYCSYRCMMAAERRQFEALKAKAAVNV